jgi:hypothetical protein
VFCSQVFDSTQLMRLSRALEVEGLAEYIAVLRVKLLTIIGHHPDCLDLQVVITNTIARMVRMKFHARKVGWIIKRLGFTKRRLGHDGRHVVVWDDELAFRLATRYGISLSPSNFAEKTSPTSPLSP